MINRFKIDLNEIDKQEFYSLTDKNGRFIKRLSSRCWEWRGTIIRGYGKYKSHQAHRISWALTFGGFDKKLNVLHKCDNRACVNPQHLYLGTQGDNIHDMWRRKRRITNNGVKKHSFGKIQEIRQLHKTGKYSLADLGRLFDMNRSMIYKIVNNHIRTHS